MNQLAGVKYYTRGKLEKSSKRYDQPRREVSTAGQLQINDEDSTISKSELKVNRLHINSW